MTAPEVAAEKPKAVKAAKKSKAKAPASHPTYKEMIRQAIISLKERNGSSRAAIFKYITKNFKVGDHENKVNASLKLALKSGVNSGILKQTKGVGASGSFRANKEEKPKKAPAKKTAAKKTASKKAVKTIKKPAAKKAASKNKTAAKKSPSKKAVKSPKKTKSAAKKPAAKKPAAKKTVAKKPAKKTAKK